MGRREDNKQAVRARIVDAATTLFSRDGFDATRARDIATAAGVTEKTFFNHFPTKQSVLEVLAHHSVELAGALIRAELEAVDRTVGERLTEIVDVLATAFTSDRRLMADAVVRSGILLGATGELRDLQRANQLLIAELFRQGQATGEVRHDVDAVQLAELFTAAWLLTTLNWLDRWWDEEEPLQQRLPRAAQVFLQGALTHNNVAPTKTPPPRRRGTRTK